ncbi:hypothetical protein BDU57DRAFT_517987 [Ampelomyces quisqualis]|uniref:Uncharacterized protein n=1 Tax=Ampelomyces quisqualis TaxID=50730 RepID=A0A6A5QIC5_AMPQU|nr:hypothetical protein BDU57DRAFT_517987 [Ampelomyces quisqualis]
MLVKLPIFASLATLAVADFQVYWFSRQAPNDQLSWGANNYGGVKLFTSKPDPKGFLAAKEIPVAANLGNTEVSDSVGGGYMCDGCPSDKDWTQWSPERIQMNGQNIFFGPSGEHYISKLCRLLPLPCQTL